MKPYIETKLEMKKLGTNIKVARKRRKLSIVQLAEQASVSRSTLSRIELGDPNVGVWKIFNVLSTLGLLYGVVDQANPEVDYKQASKEIDAWKGKKKKAMKFI